MIKIVKNIVTTNKLILGLAFIMVFSCFGCAEISENSREKVTDDKQGQVGSGIYIWGANEIYAVSPNVYVGEIVSVAQEKTTVTTPTDRRCEFISANIKVNHVYKGNWQVGSVITDQLLGTYKEFLEKGKTYLFMTGIDYENIESPCYFVCNMYEAVEIVNSKDIKIYKLEEYEKKGSYEQNYMVPAPKNYQDLLDFFQ